MTDANLEIAGLLLDLAEVYRPAARFWGYKNASRAIRRHPEFLADLDDRDILKIPGVGPASLRIVREVLERGESPTVRRVVSDSGRVKDIEAKRLLRRNFLSAAMVRRVLSEATPGVVGRTDYRGDFQMHSSGSDGRDTVAKLAIACLGRGYQYLCITDHSYGLAVAGGMSMSQVRAQQVEIDALNAQYDRAFRIFKGIEANILADGSLDLQRSELGMFDLVLAAPHSALRKSADQTDRMMSAVSLHRIHILGHPRGRMFNSRAGIVADWPAVFRRAAERGVAIEIDGDVSRQDVDFRLATAAVKAGCLFALDSDAHAADQLWMADYAIAHAKLAGIPHDRIINCWTIEKIEEWARTFHTPMASNAKTG